MASTSEKTSPTYAPPEQLLGYNTPTGGQALYDQVSAECSRLVTLRYSTSFSLAIRTLDKAYHAPICSIYGFVRFADEIVDTFQTEDKAYLLADFVTQTWEAVERGLSLNPILHAYAQVVRRYKIPRELTEAFLQSMAMDLDQKAHTDQSYDTYIYGSAEVVGLMCLRVFCEQNPAEYDRLVPPARRLGAAFQKVNFLRDIQADHDYRGRVYFPDIDLAKFDEQSKADIQADIQADFDAAYQGIRELPGGARMGVYLAYRYYLGLFDKIKRAPARHIMTTRISVPHRQKMWLLCRSLVRHRLNLI